MVRYMAEKQINDIKDLQALNGLVIVFLRNGQMQQRMLFLKHIDADSI